VFRWPTAAAYFVLVAARGDPNEANCSTLLDRDSGDRV
jgi:hypothetical protein